MKKIWIILTSFLVLIALIILGAKRFTGSNKNTSVEHSSAQFTEKSSKNNKANLQQQEKAINITIAGQKLSAHLYKNVTAKDLIQRLPITLSFSNFGSEFDEKLAIFHQN